MGRGAGGGGVYLACCRVFSALTPSVKRALDQIRVSEFKSNISLMRLGVIIGKRDHSRQ